MGSQFISQIDSGLSAELHYYAFWFFKFDDVHHIFLGQRLEI